MKVLLVLCFIFIPNGLSQTINPQLIGGNRATIANYPYMAGIFTRSHFSCGGAIINFRSVLTVRKCNFNWKQKLNWIFFQAAHCINTTPANINIIVGSSRQDGRGGVTHRVSSIFIHPEYQGENQLIADVAVVRTIISFIFTNNVRPISLGPNQVVGANERVIIAGWGLLGNDERRDMAENLHVLEMMTISNNACSAMHHNTFTRGWITSEKLCTVPTGTGNSGVCAGDRFVNFIKLKLINWFNVN